MRILVVDDEPAVREAIERALRLEGYEVEAAADGHDGLEALEARPPDAVVLDVLMPRVDGIQMCRRMRGTGDRTPVLILTARDGIGDRVTGLDLGADDYLPKPFEPRELVARMQAVLRRGPRHDEVDQLVRVGPLEVNWTTRAVSVNGRPVELTAAEFELLGLMVRNRGRVLSRERIMDAVRGIDWESYDRSVDVLVSRVRQKLGDDARRSTFIRTVRGVGYSFMGGERE